MKYNEIRNMKYGDAIGVLGRTFIAMSVDGKNVYYADVSPRKFFETSWHSLFPGRIYVAPIQRVIGFMEFA